MDRKSLRILAILPVLLAVMLTGCKKDEDDDRLSMSGDLNFDFPSYAVVGQKVESYVSGITTPSGSDLEYFWVSSDIELDGTDTDTLTGQAVSMTLPDEPGLYSITAYARSKSGEYYSTDRNTSTVVTATSTGSPRTCCMTERMTALLSAGLMTTRMGLTGYSAACTPGRTPLSASPAAALAEDLRERVLKDGRFPRSRTGRTLPWRWVKQRWTSMITGTV